MKRIYMARKGVDFHYPLMEGKWELNWGGVNCYETLAQRRRRCVCGNSMTSLTEDGFKGCKCSCNTCLERPWELLPSVGKRSPYFHESSI